MNEKMDNRHRRWGADIGEPKSKRAQHSCTAASGGPASYPETKETSLTAGHLSVFQPLVVGSPPTA